MSVPFKHVFQQGPLIGTIIKTAFSEMFRPLLPKPKQEMTIPGPCFERTLPPRPAALIEDYLRYLHRAPDHYGTIVPPHLFAQWSFVLASKTLKGLPYSLLKVVNGGCRLEIHGELPCSQDLHVQVQLTDLEDNGKRVRLCQRITTGTADQPNLIVAELYPVIPLPRKTSKEIDKTAAPKEKKQRPQVPETAKELTRWSFPKHAGLDFAKLTGDFNPIHWVGPYAKMAGFPRPILHGFASMAYAFEGINAHLYHDQRSLAWIDVRFTAPMPLPADVGLYITPDQQVFLGDAPGEKAYLVGSFSDTHDTPEASSTESP